MDITRSQAPDRLWIERVARYTGFEWLSGMLFGEENRTRFAPYLFLIGLWSFDAVGLSVWRYAIAGDWPMFQDFALLILVPSWFIVIALVRYLRGRYYAVVESLPEVPDSGAEAGDGGTTQAGAMEFHRNLGSSILQNLGFPHPVRETRKAFAEFVSTRFLVVFFLGGIAMFAVWNVILPAPVAPLAEMYGLAIARIKLFVFMPVYFLLGAEVVAVYAGIHFLLPLKITTAGIVDDTDPHGYLGLREVGRLLRDSLVLFLVIVSLFLITQAVAIGASPAGPFSLTVLLGSSVFALAAFFGPVYWLHEFMQTYKETRVAALIEEIKECGPDEEVFPNTAPELRDDPEKRKEDYAAYTHKFIQLNRVERLREFPVETHLILEFLFVLVLPYVAHLSSIFMFEYVLH